jgi:hypothetical protein
MEKRMMVVLVGLTVLGTAGQMVRGAPADAVAIINHAREITMTPNPPEHGLTQVLADVLEASLVILPQTDYAAKFKGRVEAARTAFGQGALFSDKAYKGLGEAYKMVAGGKAWQVPEELRAPRSGSIEEAKKICLKLLDSALAEHEAGRNEEAVRDLLSYVILVVTPIES